MMFVKMSILLKMIQPAKNIKSFLEYSQRISIPAPSEAEIKLLKTMKAKVLGGFVDTPELRLWVIAIKVVVPITISVSPKTGMNFFSMKGCGVTCRKKLVELRGFEPLTPCMPCRCSPS